MTLQAFITAYRAMLFQYAPWAKDIGDLNRYLEKVTDSINGFPPHYDLTDSPIAVETWRRLNIEAPLTMEKLKGLTE